MKNILSKIFLSTLVGIVGLMLIVPHALTIAYAVRVPGQSPTWEEIPSLTVLHEQGLLLEVGATDPNDDPLQYFAVSLPANAGFDAATRILTFNPTRFQLGTQEIVLAVTDGKTPPVEARLFVNVVDNTSVIRTPGRGFALDRARGDNEAPVFTTETTSYDVTAGNNVQFSVRAEDPEKDPLVYTVSGLPAGAHFDNTDRIFSWTPAVSQIGTHVLLFTAGDRHGNTGFQEVAINVSRPSLSGVFGSTGSAPRFTTSPATTAQFGAVYRYDVRAFDHDNHPVFFRIVRGPAGATIDQRTGVLTWVPTGAQGNQAYEFVIGATDARTEEVLQQFTVSVIGGSNVLAPVSISSVQPTQPVTVETPAPIVISNPTPSVQTETITVPETRVQYISTGRRSVIESPVVVTRDDVRYVAVQDTRGRIVTTRTAVQPTLVTAASKYEPIRATHLNAYGITIRTDADGDVVVSWLNTTEAHGEVVFGLRSRAANDSQIWNYTYTTGELPRGIRQEVNLGKLDMQRTYYMRVISRMNGRMDVSKEIAFVPLATSVAPVTVTTDGVTAGTDSTATASVISTGFIMTEVLAIILLLAIIGLLLFLIVRPSSQPAYIAARPDFEG